MKLSEAEAFLESKKIANIIFSHVFEPYFSRPVFTVIFIYKKLDKI